MLKASASVALCLLFSACSTAPVRQADAPTVTAATPIASAGERRVDQFEHRGHVVTVYFLDPLAQLVARDRRFASKAPAEQAQEYVSYLHSHRIYRFSVATSAGTSVGELVVEGDPAAEGSPLIYKSVRYRASGSGLERVGEGPQRGRWEAFEHMAAFQTPRGRAAVGNGVALFPGVFVRVTPYAEIKAALLPEVDRVIG